MLDVKKKTCLQIARERGNHRCVEILAPLFGFKVEQGLRDGARNEQEAILFLDFEKLHEMRDIDLQSIPLAPPQELLRWIQFDGMSWLISEDVASRTYAEDDVWITVAKGDEVVKVESMMRDCVWDAAWHKILRKTDYHLPCFYSPNSLLLEQGTESNGKGIWVRNVIVWKLCTRVSQCQGSLANLFRAA